MAPARWFLVAAASLVLLDSRARADEDGRTVKVAEDATCFPKINAARQEAGFASLVTSKDLNSQPSALQNDGTTPTGIWVDVCKTLLDSEKFKASSVSPSATYALFGLGEPGEEGLTPTDAQCSAAVKKWQEGFSSFEADPPAGKKVNYDNATPEQVSFVTLYNPVAGAKGQCTLATCKLPASKRTASEKNKEVVGLVCATSPNAFEKDPLFTEEQWNNIKRILSSSASSAMPSLLALASVLAAAFLS